MEATGILLTFVGRQSHLWLANVFCLYLIKAIDKEKLQKGFKVYFCILKKMEFHHLLTALIQLLAVVPSDNGLTLLVENISYHLDHIKAFTVLHLIC